MAKIVSSDRAPKGEVHYSLGSGASFTLGGKSDSFKCDDASVLARASAHSWLDVKRDPAEGVEPIFRNPSVAPKDDPLSAQSAEASKANDPKAIKATEDAKGVEIIEVDGHEKVVTSPSKPPAAKKAAQTTDKEN